MFCVGSWGMVFVVSAGTGRRRDGSCFESMAASVPLYRAELYIRCWLSGPRCALARDLVRSEAKVGG